MRKDSFVDADKEWLEIHHNLFAQASPAPEMDCECTPEEFVVTARHMSQTQEKVSCNAAAFA